jgi:beta-RFAP synthase
VLAFAGQDLPDASRLARLLGRGRRSAIGTHGFAQGGLVVDGGKTVADSVAPLIARAEPLDDWRIVLLLPLGGAGLFGAEERRAFDVLPAVDRATQQTLRRIAESRMLPAAREGEYDRFGEALYEYNHLAGSCYAQVQGGPYSSVRAARWVERLRRMGIAGVGQSSWGPTLFAVCANAGVATRLVEMLEHEAAADGWSLLSTRAANRGAKIEAMSDG